jgi:O-antigen ligase
MALDVTGAGLVVVAGAWMVWTRIEAGGSAAPGVTLLAACGLVVGAVRAFPDGIRRFVPAFALLAAIILAARSESALVSSHPSTGLFGYPNAEGALYVQAAIAGLMVACTNGAWPIRAAGAAGAAAFAVLPLFIGAVAAATLVLVLPAIALGCFVLAGARRTRVPVMVLGVVLVVALTASIALGATYSPGDAGGDVQRAASSMIDQERLALWHDALSIMRENPVGGVGPGRYQVVSPIGSVDPDSRWAHNEFLQQGAEGGIPGLLLLVGLFGWGFVRLWVVERPGILTALSAASLAALGIHASVDYVMHFPAIPIMTAALVATGMVEPAQSFGREASERDEPVRARSGS